MAKHRFTVIAVGLLASVLFMYLAVRRQAARAAPCMAS
jgi:hypothetical protein